MVLMNKTYEQQLRDRASVQIIRYYKDALTGVELNKAFFTNTLTYSRFKFDDVVNASAEKNPNFKYLQDLIKNLCGSDHANDRFRYYYIPAFFKALNKEVQTALINTTYVSSLIGFCSYISSLSDNVINDDILINVQKVTNCFIALFMLWRKIDGYEDIVVECIGMDKIDDVITKIATEDADQSR